MIKPRTAIFGTFLIWAVITGIYYFRKANVILQSPDRTKEEQIVQAGPEPNNDKKHENLEKKVKSESSTKEDEEIARNQPIFDGEIKTGDNMCLDTLEGNNENVGLWACHGEGRNQYWHVTKDHMIRNDKRCIQARPEQDQNKLARFVNCDGSIQEQKWYQKDGSLILSGTKRCLHAESNEGLTVIPCDGSDKQKFKLVQIAGDLVG